MRDRRIRVVSPVDEPFTNECFTSYPSDQSCTMPGVEVEYLFIILNKFMRYPIEWVRVETYEEMDEYLQEGKADVQGISQDYQQYIIDKGFANSPIFLRDSYMLIVKEDVGFDADPFGVLKVFHWSLWFSLIGSLLGFYVLEKAAEALLGSNAKSTNYRVLHWMRDKMGQAFWLIVVTMFMGFYTNIMSIDLIIRKKTSHVPFRTFEEFHRKLKSGECKWLLLDYYENDDEFWPSIINPNASENRNPWAKGFSDAYAVTKPLYMGSRDEIVERVKTSQECLVGLDYISIRPYYESRHCGIKMFAEMPLTDADLHSSKPVIAGLPSFNFMYWIGENSTFFLTEMEEVLAGDAVNNLYEYLAQKYYRIPHPPECKSQFSQREFTPMAVDKIWGPIWIFAGVSIGCLLVLAAEVFSRLCTNEVKVPREIQRQKTAWELV